MNNYPLWKSLLVIIVILLGIIFSIPSFIYNEDSNHWFLKNKINLGLDLQGGSYLLLEVKSEVLFKEELDNISDSDFRVEAGTRIVQICDPMLRPITFEMVNSLSDTSRGQGGLGSTG